MRVHWEVAVASKIDNTVEMTAGVTKFKVMYHVQGSQHSSSEGKTRFSASRVEYFNPLADTLHSVLSGLARLPRHSEHVGSIWNNEAAACSSTCIPQILSYFMWAIYRCTEIYCGLKEHKDWAPRCCPLQGRVTHVHFFCTIIIYHDQEFLRGSCHHPWSPSAFCFDELESFVSRVNMIMNIKHQRVHCSVFWLRDIPQLFAQDVGNKVTETPAQKNTLEWPTQ